MSHPLPVRVSAALLAVPGVDEVASHHVSDVLRICSLTEQVVELAGFLVRQPVRQLLTSARGAFDVGVEVSTGNVTVTVTGPGDGLFDGFTLDPLGSGSDVARRAVTSGVRREGGTTSAWFAVAGAPGAAVDRPERGEPGPRSQTLAQISTALSAAETVTAVSDGVTGAVRAYLGAAFTGIAVLDPLAVGYIRYVTMDPLPAETAQDWAEIPIGNTSPVGAAAQGRPTYFSSQAAAEQSFPGIAEHMRIAGVCAIAHVPLSVDGTSIGTMAVSWADEHPIGVEERALLATVAAYTAVAVARCRASAGGAQPDPAAVTSAAASSPTAGEVRPLRVLLVDDTADIRELLTGLFARRSDVQVVGAASNGAEAIELAAALQPDIVVMDVAMPVLDGISALPPLIAAAPHARVVMLSALPAELRAPVALATGATAYVEKTTAVATLVDDLLEGARLLDVAVRRLTEQVDQQLDADPRQIQLARHFVADTLERWDQSPLGDTIVLLLSELVTNAVVHARSAPRVSVRLLPDRVHVEVTDQDAEVVHALPPTLNRTSGRGLAIVESLSMGWGTALLPQGKVVWFDVARESA